MSRLEPVPDGYSTVTPYDEHGEGEPLVLIQEKPDLVNKIVVDFLTKEPVPTVAPIRRAPKSEVSPG
jgi:hypothetical protein